MPNDCKLWNDFREGKKYALSQIYHENIELLYSYGKRFTYDDELVKDTIQELFYDLIRTRKNLSGTDNIRIYLFISFRRKLLRKVTRAKKISCTHKHIEQTDTTAVLSSEEVFISNENRIKNKELILNALNNLSPKQREILYYRFTCDFEYEQICKIMSMKDIIALC